MLLEVQNLTQVFGGIIVAFVAMWEVTLPITFIIIICMVIYYIGDKIADKFWLEFNMSSSTATSKAEEVITSFRAIKAFNNELREAKKYGKAIDNVDKVFKKTSLAQGINDSSIWLIVNLSTAGFIYFSTFLVVKKPEMNYTSGDIVILIFCLIFSAMGISSAL